MQESVVTISLCIYLLDRLQARVIHKEGFPVTKIHSYGTVKLLTVMDANTTCVFSFHSYITESIKNY